jgi:hypothetical protein
MRLEIAAAIKIPHYFQETMLKDLKEPVAKM